MWSGALRAFRRVRCGLPCASEELGLGPLVIHANYLINLAGMQPMLRTRSIQAFHDDLVRGIALGQIF